MKKIIHIPLAVLCCLMVAITSIEAQTTEKKKLVPTITIPAPPGSKGFGMPPTPKPGETTPPPRRNRPSASVTDTMRVIKTVHIDSLNMSDPFILADDATKTYYLTSSGGAIYKSTDLKN